jgi:hypothetical protein
MIGDLPEADAAPPPNMLFVCKLNPVTSEEDLDIIFSRFGNITSCDIIRCVRGCGAWVGVGVGVGLLAGCSVCPALCRWPCSCLLACCMSPAK